MSLCRNPFIKGGAAYPCGRCEPCRWNARRLWKHRIMLERLCHADSMFLTLTYDDDHLVFDWRTRRPILVRKHLQDFLKRFRSQVEPLRFRFYGVGEYGDRSERPHYHVVIFGFPTCFSERTHRVFGTSRADWKHCCPICELVGDTWGQGDVDLGTVTSDSASYISAYVLKKMTRDDDPRLFGRPPEFCSMSLKPGIGSDAMWDVASTMMHYGLDEVMVDVPYALKHGKADLPLGRYLRRRLRQMTGRDEKAPPEVLEKMEAELLPLRLAAKASEDNPSFKRHVSGVDDGRVARIAARNLIFKTEKKL